MPQHAKITNGLERPDKLWRQNRIWEVAEVDLVPWHAYAHVKGTIGHTTDPKTLTKTVNEVGAEADLVL